MDCQFCNHTFFRKTNINVFVSRSMVNEVFFHLDHKIRINCIVSVLAHNNLVNNLSLQYMQNVKQEEILSLAKALMTNTSVTKLNLNGTRIDSLGAGNLAAMLMTNTTLKSLHIYGTFYEDVSIKLILQALKVNSTLTNLSFGNNEGINPSQTIELTEILKSANCNLEKFHLTNATIDDIAGEQLVKALRINSTLKELDLADGSWSDITAARMTDHLKSNTTLTCIHLPPCNSTTTLVGLGDVLKLNTTLTRIDLSHCQISGLEVAAIAEALQTNATLDCLDLSGSDDEIGNSGTTSLVNALKINSTLRTLSLMNNSSGVSTEVAASFADALLSENQSLTSLNLDAWKFGEEGLAKFAEVIKSNTALTDLSLVESDLDGKSMKLIAEALRFDPLRTNNPILRYFSLENLELEGQYEDDIITALESNISLTSVSTQDTDFSELTLRRLNDLLRRNIANMPARESLYAGLLKQTGLGLLTTSIDDLFKDLPSLPTCSSSDFPMHPLSDDTETSLPSSSNESDTHPRPDDSEIDPKRQRKM